MKPKYTPPPEKVELQMTPMIDVVFQLLIFFLLTFKIATPEGDFNIKMPIGAAAQNVSTDIPLPVITVRLVAGDDGKLAGIRLGERSLTGFDELHRHILSLVGDAGPGQNQGEAEVELDCDFNLDYRYVVEAITAISGRVEAGQIIPLVEKIKFAPPRKAGETAES